MDTRELDALLRGCIDDIVHNAKLSRAGTYALAKQAVDLVLVGTAGRPSVRIDVVGYLLP